MKSKKSQRLLLLTVTVMCILCFSAQGIFAYTWSDFRGNPENNGVTDIALPTKSDDATLYWASKIGEGWQVAPSCPIIVDDVVVMFAKSTVYKLDAVTGEILQQADLKGAGNSSWNITPPTYADGKIFMALANGKIQAVDFETLENCWLYQHENKRGQSNSPVVYHNGYVYTGYWNTGDSEAPFVCVDAATGEEVWSFMHKGGFYWAGCYVNDHYLLVGSDDGSGSGDDAVENPSETSVLYSLNPKTGEEIDTIEGLNGDIRSTVMFEDNGDGSGTAYFTSEGGSFYGVPVDANGNLDEEHMSEIKLGGPSCSTPVIHNGRAYVGVQGEKGHFVQYGGHSFAVIDLAANKIAYTCPTQGYTQTSGLLTTAYESADGYTYVYFFDNYTPGKLRVIKDKPGQTRMISDSKYADILFTPAKEQAQYVLCSPICDNYGTLYFKNDSGYIMACGWNIKNLEVTKAPNKTQYKAGEIFDPAGMEVIATYANGKTRDVTKYLKYNINPLTTADIEITLTFPHVMYHDADDGDNTNDVNKINQPTKPLYASVDITVTEDKAAQVIDIIDALDGRISEKSVADARAAYNKLSAEDRAKVSNYDKLTAAEAKIKVNPFKDVQKSAWYGDAVLFNSRNGLMNGMESDVFAPDAQTTRAQLVVILYRYAGSPDVSGATSFTDVKADWYKDAVLWANKNNIVNGTSATTFSPDAFITREQLVTILHRYCQNQKILNYNQITSISSFPDASKVSNYALKSFQWAVKQGVISGSDDGGKTVLAPQGNATRAQIATIMMRFVLAQ